MAIEHHNQRLIWKKYILCVTISTPSQRCFQILWETLLTAQTKKKQKAGVVKYAAATP